MLKIRDLGVSLSMSDAGLPMQEPPAPVFPQYAWTTARPGCPPDKDKDKDKDKDDQKSGGSSKTSKTSKKSGKKTLGLGGDALLLLERQLDEHLGNGH